MALRSEAEWRELVKRLREVAADKDEEKVRRQRALAILETVPREYLQDPVPPVDYDETFDGKIV